MREKIGHWSRDGVDVWTALDSEAMARFERDRELRRYRQVGAEEKAQVR